MKKLSLFPIISAIALLNTFSAKSQSIGLNVKELFKTEKESYSKNPVYPILEDFTHTSSDDELIVYNRVQFQDPTIKKTKLTILFKPTGEFRNLSYGATIQYGENFNPKVFFDLCGLESDFIIISQDLEGKYFLEFSEVIFPKSKIRVLYSVDKEEDDLKYNVNFLPAKEEEIKSALELKNASSERLSFSTQSLKNPDEYIEFQGLRLGKKLFDSGVTELLDPYDLTISDGDLAYAGSGTIVGIPTQIVFYFNKSVFYRGIYKLDQDYVNKNNFNEDFEKLEKLLIKKYGNPKNQGDIWSNDLFKSDASNIGLAISAGHLKRVRIWEIEGIRITLGITGENFKINTYLGYQLMSISEEVKKESEMNLLDEL